MREEDADLLAAMERFMERGGTPEELLRAVILATPEERRDEMRAAIAERFEDLLSRKH